MAYCTAVQVKGKLSTAFSSTDVPDSSTAANMPLSVMIANADEIINAALRPYCYTFNAVDTATWPTPAVINLASIHFAASQAFEQLVLIQNNEGLGASAQYHVEQGNALLAGIVAARGETGLEVTTAETLSFGTDAGAPWALNSDEAYLASTSPLTSTEPPHIIRERVRLAITDAGDSSYSAAELNRMRYADDDHAGEYTVKFDLARGKWIFRAFHPDLLLATVIVKYQWNYQRNAGDGWPGV